MAENVENVESQAQRWLDQHGAPPSRAHHGLAKGWPYVLTEGRFALYKFEDGSVILADREASRVAPNPFWLLQPRTDCNVHRLDQLADRLRNGVPYFLVGDPEDFISNTGWVDDPERVSTGFNMTYFFEKLLPTDERYDTFDSVADLTGWAMICFAEDKLPETEYTEDVVKHCDLRLHDDEAQALFHPRGDDVQVGAPPRLLNEWDRLADAQRRPIQPHHAATAISRFLDGWPLHKLYDFR